MFFVSYHETTEKSELAQPGKTIRTLMLYVNCRTDNKQNVNSLPLMNINLLYVYTSVLLLLCGEMFALLKLELCSLQTRVQRKCSQPLLEQSTDETFS